MPLSLCKLVTIHINLYRLPFKYKIYYDKINKKFKAFKDNEENKNKKITDILCDYYSMKLNFEEKKNQAVYLSLEFDYEREKSIGDLIKLLRKIPLLELEPENFEPSIAEQEFQENKIRHLTELIAYFSDKDKIINNNMIIDKFVDINDKMQLNIYEVLNTNGFLMIQNNYIQKKVYNLFTYQFNKKCISSINEFTEKIKNSTYFDKESEKLKTPGKINQIEQLQTQENSTNNNNENKKEEEKNNEEKNIKEENNEEKNNEEKNKEEKNKEEKYDEDKKEDETNIGDKNNKEKKEDEKNKEEKKIEEIDDKKVNGEKEGIEGIDNEKTEDIDSEIKKNEKISEKEQNKGPLSLLSIHDKLCYLDNQNKDKKNNEIQTKFIYEFAIPIVHYRRESGDTQFTIFYDFYHIKMNDFPMQILILNNDSSSKITSKDLYNYIWDYNSLYMNHPNKNKDNFWFNIYNNNNKEEDKGYKKCYPFVIRLVKQNTKYPLPFKCAKCQWYNFCLGCVLSPEKENVKFEPDYIIFVDWCYSLIQEEIDSQNFYYKTFSNDEITLSLESAVKNDKSKQYQSIQDCFDLFFEEESLEDPLYCKHCGGPQNFIKNYEINKLPYVLVLALKRFKYNENNNFKLKQLITFPIDNYDIKGKKYNLFGVVYHYGGINSGHYVCAVRNKENKWILCDDNVLKEIDVKKVMTSNAYILVYISQDPINTYSYYNCMQSLLQHIIVDKLRRSHSFRDNNFFKGEPIRVNSKDIGYVVEDYLEDFIIEKNENKGDDNQDNKQENIINKDEEEKNDLEQNPNNIKKEEKIKVKLESQKEEQYIDKNQIEKLILVDEQIKTKK